MSEWTEGKKIPVLVYTEKECDREVAMSCAIASFGEKAKGWPLVSREEMIECAAKDDIPEVIKAYITEHKVVGNPDIEFHRLKILSMIKVDKIKTEMLITARPELN